MRISFIKINTRQSQTCCRECAALSHSAAPQPPRNRLARALEPRAAVRRQRAAPHSAIGVNAQPSHEELCSCLTGTCSPRRHTLVRSPAAPPQSAPTPSPNSPASVRSGCRRRRGFPGRASHCGPTGAGGLRRLLTALIKLTHSQRPRESEEDQETHRKNCGGMRES